MKPRAYFLVSPALLAQALHVPSDGEIIGVDWDWQRSCVRVFVESDQFSENEVGVPLQNRLVLITRHSRIAEPTDYIHTFISEWEAV